MEFFNNVILSKDNLINNIKVIKQQATSKQICAMVKANAYNHSLKFVVLNLKNYVRFFGVASTSEALQVRELTNKNKILLCGVYNSSCLKSLILNNISLSVYSLNQLASGILWSLPNFSCLCKDCFVSFVLALMYKYFILSFPPTCIRKHCFNFSHIFNHQNQ